MPIKSYIVFPRSGKKTQLINLLTKTENCDVVPSTNKEVIVLVTDTENDQQEEELQQILDAIKEIEHLNLVSGFSDKATQL